MDKNRLEHQVVKDAPDVWLVEALGVEGAAELKESAFSSDGLTVTLGRTADGKAKASVKPEGSPSVFFLHVKVK